MEMQIASLKVLGHIEWRLFCNLFPTFRHMKEEKTCNRSHTASSTYCCLFYSLVAAAVMCPKDLDGPPKVWFITSIRMEP